MYLPTMYTVHINSTGRVQKTGHKGKKGIPPLSEEVPYEITLIRLSQVSLDRRRREKVIWEMITEHTLLVLYLQYKGISVPYNRVLLVQPAEHPH